MRVQLLLARAPCRSLRLCMRACLLACLLACLCPHAHSLPRTRMPDLQGQLMPDARACLTCRVSSCLMHALA